MKEVEMKASEEVKKIHDVKKMLDLAACKSSAKKGSYLKFCKEHE
jgi:hypothetical protein